MTTEAIESQLATEAEIAETEALAAQALSREDIRHGEQVPTSDVPELQGAVKPLQYRIDPADVGSWVMVWELKVDTNGLEYGVPRRAPRQQLGLWLQKRREFDGGVRFTVDQPTRIAAEPQFKCLRQECRKRLYTRLDLVEHVENAHGREAKLYRKLLDQIMDKAAQDNPRVRELAETYAQMQDTGIVSVAVRSSQPREEGLNLSAGAPVVTSVGGITPEETEEVYRCRRPGCKRFFDSDPGRQIHETKPHKE